MGKVDAVANTLGLNISVMRLVEQRDTTDRWIVYGGMVGVCCLLFFLIFFVRPWLFG